EFVLLPRLCPLLLILLRRSPISTLSPYTTLFRSLIIYVSGINTKRRGLRPRRFVSALLPSRTDDKDNEEADGDNDQETKEEFVEDRKSTRLNSSHVKISYAVCCVKKKNATTWTRM